MPTDSPRPGGIGRRYFATLIAIVMSLIGTVAIAKDADTLEKSLQSFDEAVRVNDGPLATQLRTTLLGEIKNLLVAGKIKEAKETAVKMMSALSKSIGEKHPGYGRTMGMVGALYVDVNLFDDANATLEQAFSLLHAIRGPDHIEVARVNLVLSMLRQKQRNFSEAETEAKRAIVIAEKSGSAQAAFIASCWLQLSHVYLEMERQEDSLQAAVTAFDLLRTAVGDSAPETLLAQLRVADAQFLLKRYAEAEAGYIALALSKGSATTPDSAELAELNSSIADAIWLQGRPREAMAYLEKALALVKGEDTQTTSTIARDVALTLAVVANELKQLPRAEQALRIVLRIQEQTHAPPGEIGYTLGRLGDCVSKQKRQTEAIEIYEKAATLLEGHDSPKFQRLVPVLQQLAYGFFATKNWTMSETTYLRLLDMLERRSNGEDEEIAWTLNWLGVSTEKQERLDVAERYYQRALETHQKHGSSNKGLPALVLHNLASLAWSRGQLEQAAGFYQRAIVEHERHDGINAPDTLGVIESYGGLLMLLGRQNELAPTLERAISAFERSPTPDPKLYGRAEAALGMLRFQAGDLGSAERLIKSALDRMQGIPEMDAELVRASRVLTIIYLRAGRLASVEELSNYLLSELAKVDEAVGSKHSATTMSLLEGIAATYTLLGLRDHADPIYKRAIELSEKQFGTESTETAHRKFLFGIHLSDSDRPELAANLLETSVATFQKTKGDTDGQTAFAMAALGNAYRHLGRLRDAERVLEPAVMTLAGIQSEHAVPSKQSLGIVYALANKMPEAEGMFQAALDELEQKGITRGNLRAIAAFGLAYTLYRKGDSKAALAIFRPEMSSLLQQFSGLSKREVSANLKRFRLGLRAYLWTLQGMLSTSSAADREKLLDEAFSLMQLHRSNDTAAVVDQMAVRLAQSHSPLGQVIWDYQQLQEQEKHAESQMAEAITQGNRPKQQSLIATTSMLREQRNKVWDRLEREFPKYAELTGIKPISIERIRTALSESEALLSWVFGEGESNLIVIRRSGATMIRLAITEVEVGKMVSVLREALDPLIAGGLAPFPAITSSSLYKAVLAPAMPHLQGVTDLLVIPDGAMTSLPPAVLLTNDMNGKAALNLPSEFRNAPWLARQFAITVLPSVSTLPVLKALGPTKEAKLPFFGVGDPVLAPGELEQSRSKRKIPGAVRIDTTTLYRGAIGNVDVLRQLPSLPETADELRKMARLLGADESALVLGSTATETNVKSMDLSNRRVLAFATHGAVAGALRGINEPALVLTPPTVASDKDDGLLQASEIGALKLDADWVILSACNSAASDGTAGSEGLSGLAKSFIFAGARTLLASHWSIPSEATVELTTQTLRGAAGKTIGRAEAHRRAMMTLADSDDPGLSHPSAWAAFVVIGAGWAVH